MVMQAETSDTTKVSPEPYQGGLNLSDLIIGISGVWALPVAAMDVMGRHSVWYFIALPVAGVGSLFWAWYFRRIGQFFAGKIRVRKGIAPSADLPLRIVMALYLGELGLSFLLQYALYRLVHFALKSV
jgi:hypothetical protein